MARFDKVEPKGGSFRAPLGFAIAAADVGDVVGVGLDANGVAQKSGSQTGIVGVICPSSQAAVGDPIDVMTDGEIVDVAGLAAGTVYYAADADGAVDTTAPAAGVAGVRVGHTVQSWRLVVRVQSVVGVA
jgi:hypothetical protein